MSGPFAGVSVRGQGLFGDQPPQQGDGAGHAEPRKDNLGPLGIGGSVISHESLLMEAGNIRNDFGLCQEGRRCCQSKIMR